MKKFTVLLFAIILTASLTACGGNSTIENQDLQDDTTSVIEDETTTEEDNSGDVETVQWPEFLESDIPAIEGINIESVYPETEGSSDYVIAITVSEDDKDLLSAYAEDLVAAGFTQDSVSENNFGVNYNFSNDKYNVFINTVYDGYSKIGITVK